MMNPRTIVTALSEAAAARPDKGFLFLDERGHATHCPFPALLRRSHGVAAALIERGLQRGDRVVLAIPSAEEFVPVFLGTLCAGGLPVPVYPPLSLAHLSSYLEYCRHIVRAARADYFVTNRELRAVLGSVGEAAVGLRDMMVGADLDGDPASVALPDLHPGEPAFIQFTSGSTSSPRGVVVTHENLMANSLAIIREGVHPTPDDHAVSWLPLYHDMGLFGFVISPIMCHMPVTLIPTLAFLKRPATWIRILSSHGGTITYAPNFGYALTTQRVRDEELAGVDLSRVRIAGCGAEPIQAETLRGFARRFASHGFRASALVPSYGMAESTLAVSFSHGLVTEHVRASRLAEAGIAELADPGDPAVVEAVSCGPAFAGHAVRVVDRETGAELPERRVGELRLKGPSVMPGYYQDAEATRAVFDDQEWLRTGDLGYLAASRIFVCGRLKDVIIVHGKNYYPQDIEWAASRVPGVRAGNVVAFRKPMSGAGDGREGVVIVAESRLPPERRAPLGLEIQQAVLERCGLRIDDVVVAEPGSIPKTTSGKVQRARTAALHAAGQLARRHPDGLLRVARNLLHSQLAHLRRGALERRRG